MLVLSRRDAAWHSFPFLPYARPNTTAPHTKIKPHKTVRFYSAIPILQMHYCTFVIIGPEGDPDTLVAKALEPFDEQLKVAPYRKYLEQYEIVRMSKHYKLDQHNLHALAERLADWVGWPGGVDRRGLFYTTTLNPDGRWDWYEIGGRWNGYIKGAKWNVISTGALLKSPHLKDALPCYVLTPDGTWLEHERFFPDEFPKGRFERKPDDVWLQEVRAALERHPNSRVVCVDIHN